MKHYRVKSRRQLASFIFSIAILGLIFSPFPGISAITIDVAFPQGNTVTQSNNFECSITVVLNSGEDLPDVGTIRLIIDESTPNQKVSEFTLSGNPVGPSDPAIPANLFSLKTTLPALDPNSYSNLYGISGFSNSIPNYGYGYGYAFLYGYGYGYGSGFPGPSTFSYDCGIDSSQLNVGLHTFTAEVAAPLQPVSVFVSFPQEFTVLQSLDHNLSGKVTDEQSNGILGVEVSVIDTTTLNTVASTTTDANGDYALTVITGLYNINVVPPLGIGLQGVTIPDVSISADTILNVALEPAVPVTFSGTLTDRDGTAVPNQLIRLLGGPIQSSVSTDANGFFSLTVAPDTT